MYSSSLFVYPLHLTYILLLLLSLSLSLSACLSRTHAHVRSLSRICTLTHKHARYDRQPSHLTDIIRCRVFFQDFQSILHFVEAIRSNALVPDDSSENTRVHDLPARTFKFCGVKNRFSPGYQAIQSFGFRDLQMNLEVGFRYADVMRFRFVCMIYIHVYICICLYIYTFVCACARACLCIYTSVCIYGCMGIINIHT